MTLNVQDLKVGRAGIALLDGVSFDVCAGDVLVLRGPNGIGKTSLLRSLAGLQPVLGGRVDVAPDSMAYGAHADGVKGTLTVVENLTFWARVHGHPVRADVFDAFDLAHLKDRTAAQLSAGQQRRLGLARLAVTGRLGLLLDEPTVSLDAASVALFAAFIQRHLATGGFAVIATHIDLELKAEVLDLTPYKAQAAAADPAGFDEAFL
ncbi:heme ABC exporter ATP-binding protein CcmA [Actibacterium sp. 188UL27-1]|uniref:heme ABC exporter ATP-binding protein CcmA n=1 Tax=Actibacterium sp. 188UL27-1 TaxID=2786961 RepID=UPI00195CECC2|nr:heme ABC exporter ATP-binding protein CcmA [Actibacterium sp. 188UL27-1]MBM7066693.1 heme ABC exporter ATP-binding protein CcmA [Actibacterium sp. 188UL27-1]